MRLPAKQTGFKDASWELNPVQELFAPIMNTPDNKLVRAPTASGKTTAIPMAAHKHLEEGGLLVYIGVMKALCDEKREDWSAPDHPWSGYAMASVTGDFKWTDQQAKEVDKAQIIVITPEALISRLRSRGSERSAFLDRISILAIDEIHLVGAGERGANMEVALMEFTSAFPHVELLALSATIPNVEDFQEWLSVLNRKDTYLLKSDFRPVPLKRHYLRYTSKRSQDIEAERLDLIEELVLSKPDEQWMVCVWNKAFGKKIKDRLTRLGIPCAFHNANLGRAARKDIEWGFKSGGLRVIINTSTLTTGVNLPARNVIITSVVAGGQWIPAFELLQAEGRAGRPAYDDRGFVYYLLPAADAADHIYRIENGERIESSLHDKEVLATHLLGALYLNVVQTKAHFYKWFKRSLSWVQMRQTDEQIDALLDEVVQDMSKHAMLKEDVIRGKLTLTRRGIIAAQLMVDPYHLASLIYNFWRYSQLLNPNDLDLAVAIGAVDPFWANYHTPLELSEIHDVIKTGAANKRGYWKAIEVVYSRIQGKPVPDLFANINYQIYSDIDRVCEAVVRVHNESERWDGLSEERLRAAFMRVRLSCGWKEASLRTSQFTKAEARRLGAIGLHTIEDVRQNASIAATVLKPDRLEQLL